MAGTRVRSAAIPSPRERTMRMYGVKGFPADATVPTVVLKVIAAGAPVFASHLLVNEGAIRIGGWLAYLNLGPVSMEAITRNNAARHLPDLLQTLWIYAPTLGLFTAAGMVKAIK